MTDTNAAVFFPGAGNEWRKVPIRQPVIKLARLYANPLILWPLRLGAILEECTDRPDELALRCCLGYHWDTKPDEPVYRWMIFEAFKRIGLHAVVCVQEDLQEERKTAVPSSQKQKAYEIDALEVVRLAMERWNEKNVSDVREDV